MRMVWLDVTSILMWMRPAVGVIRTEAEFADYVISSNNESFSFCQFDGVSGFNEVPREAVCAALDRINSHVSITTLPPASTNFPFTAKDKAKKKILDFISLLPINLQPSVIGFIQHYIQLPKVILAKLLKIRFFAFCLIQKYFPKLAKLQFEKKADALDTPFRKGDVYLSMGADWNHGDLSYLYSLKHQIGFKVVLFCYDIIPIKLPHLAIDWVAERFVRYFCNLAWVADEILCISECSRRDLDGFLNEIGAPIPPMSVVKLGCQLPTMAEITVSAEVQQVLDQRYVLFVSTIERRKNHEVLYRAYIRLVEQGHSNLPLLVFVGMPGWGVNDFLADLHYDPRITGRIKVLNHIADPELRMLYNHAYFTVFPSLYEGWGLPVAESLAAGKFCLASDSASIPEIGGELVEYIDPWDIHKWASRLLWYFNNPDEVLKREILIKSSYRPTTWTDTSLEILNALKL